MKKSLLATLLLSLTLVLAACGNSDNNDSEGTESNDSNESSEESGSTESESSDGALDITATDFEFDQDEYTVESGEEITVNLTSEEGTHGLAIAEFDVDIQGDGEVTFTPDEPGEYTIYCSVPCGEGHDDMKSTLVVK